MGYNVGNVKMEPDSLLKWVIMLECQNETRQFIEMSYNVGNVKMKPDSLLK